MIARKEQIAYNNEQEKHEIIKINDTMISIIMINKCVNDMKILKLPHNKVTFKKA